MAADADADTTAPPSNVPRTRTGCQACRIRHLRCDEKKPCGRCEKSGLECVRGFNIRFRHGANPSVLANGGPRCDYDFDKDQTWLRPKQALSFVDETKELIGGYNQCDADKTTVLEIQEVQPTEDDTSNARESEVEKQSSPLHMRHNSHGSAVQALAMLAGNASPVQRTFSGYAGSPASAPGYLDTPFDQRRNFGRSGSYSGTSLDGRNPSGKKRKIVDSSAPFTPPYYLAPDLPSRSHADIFESPQTPRSDVHMHYRPVPAIPVTMLGVFTHGLEGSTIQDPSPHDYDNLTEPTPEDMDEGFNAVSKTLSRIYLEAPVWPLRHNEAFLMRHFVEHIAPSFDLCDKDRHFTSIVPQRAAICPTLLNAVLAASACHLERTADFAGHFDHMQYHQKCLDHLIPMLGDTAAIMDENLLAATVILRYMEEIEVSICGTDSQNHLLGTHVFISAQEASTIQGGLREAAYWVALRQEVYVAFVSQRTISPALHRVHADEFLGPADDFTWANRIIVHCANVIRFCFGDGERSIPQYNRLCEYGQQWMLFKPSGFSPIHHVEPSEVAGKIFPELWLLGDNSVCALQHWHLARILLAAHNPKIPRLGPGQKRALKDIDRDIKSSVLAICGMAESNAKSPPNWVTACLAIAMCGERFSRRVEQDALLGVLATTEEVHGWPTGTAIRALSDMWERVDLVDEGGVA